ncbi:MAG: hypothetical protein JTT11_03610 [Candidatus Brockarchaeota archaeon]|nr:hypothetical protein [Candidatus Brockarchaeota archaeon]
MGLLFVTVASGFEKEAAKELGNSLGRDAVRCRPVFKGIVIASTSIDGRKAAKILEGRSTNYVAKVVPVDRVVEADVGKIVGSVLELGGIGENDSFAVRCARRGNHRFSSRDVERIVGNAIERGRVDLENPQVTVNVEILFGKAYVSVLKAGDAVSKRLGVERKWEKGERPVNRSELKMAEILDLLPRVGPYKVAIDLGSAPGGWTKVLSRHAEKVYSVDPARLDDEVSKLGNVSHVRKKMEELTAEDVPQRADIITCDANIPAKELVPLVGKVAADFLAEKGLLVLTLKASSPKAGEELEEAVRALAEELEALRVEVLAVTRLGHNTRRELTCICEGR